MKNVILLTIDALRKDVLGCYGNKDNLTPFIDSIQNKCIRFNRMQSIGPYTQASFPGILTSSYYFDYGKQKRLSPQRTLISEILKKEGITTAAFHSNAYLSDYFGWNRGWDIFYDSMQDNVSDEFPYIRGGEINKKVAMWLTSYTQGSDYKPFFLWVHYMDIHEPYVAEKKYLNMVDPTINITQDEMFELFKKVLLRRDVSKDETVKLLKNLYKAHVREVDDYIKKFFTILEKLELLVDSAIIITSDHGDEFNEHGGLSHDGKMYSELIDIPSLIYDYNKDNQEVCNILVSNTDISPTIIQLFGINPVKNFKGHSLLPLKDYSRNGVYGEAVDKIGHTEKETDKPIYYYREEDLKIIYHERDDRWEMYELKEDPEELNNIIDTSSMADEMKEKLTQKINVKVNGES